MAKKSNDGIFHVWMQKRFEDNYQGLYEFPGGKIEANETPGQAVVREIREEVEIELLETSLFKLYPYEYPERKVLLYSFLVQHHIEYDSSMKAKGEWFALTDEKIDELQDQVLPANGKILRDVKAYLEKNFKERELETLWAM